MAASRGEGKPKREEFKKEDVMQAVVIADSFNVRFGPLTNEKPRVLLPLVTQPIIDYTLEFLASAGIEQIIVFCRNHADQIKRHIQNFKWGKDSNPCEVRTVVSETCLSIGDALRELDAQGLIQSDFVLVNGDLVSNINLKVILEEHKARRLREKTPVMTLVFRQAPPNHKSRCKEDNIFITMTKDKQRVLHYQRVQNNKAFQLPLEIFQENHEVEMRNDLLDCQICMCSALVPMLFTENFDYQTRDDFVKGILDNMEILGNTIHIHVVKDTYATRISNLTTYDAVSQDVISRWCYPLVPNCSLSQDADQRLTYGRHNVYKHRDVTLARGSCLKQNVVIGQGSTVGAGSKITHSVIGKKCHIGENVSLDHAYLWDGVRVEDDCKITSSILADNVHTKEGVTIKPGTVLSYGVIVGPKVTIPEQQFYMSTPNQAEDDFGEKDTSESKESECMVDVSIAGEDRLAYKYEVEVDSDDEAESLVQDEWGQLVPSGEDDDCDDSDAESVSSAATPPPDESKLFLDEVLGTLERADEENITVENMVLEVNSLKHAYGIQIKEVNQLLTKVILCLPFQDKMPATASEYLNQLKMPFKSFLPLLRNYIKSEESQLDCLESLEELAGSQDVVRTSLVKILNFFYDKDLLSEEAILKWFENPPDSADPSYIKEIRSKVQPFIDWLEDAEEEESDED